MRIALIGYGNMGREVEEAAREAGVEVGCILTARNNAEGAGLSAEKLGGIDVCVDFSASRAVSENILRVCDAQKPMVVGTTGWYGSLAEVKKAVEQSGIGFVYGPNFSVGVNLLVEIVNYAAELMKGHAEFDPYVLELHHRKKADHPSGTALQLGNILLEHLGSKKNLVSALEGRIPEDGLNVASVRAGSHPGTHVVGFDAAYETLEITHRVRHRRTFARGALLAAQWIQHRKGFFTFKEALQSLWKGEEI